MALTVDRVTAAITALADQRIPNLNDLDALCQAWKRMQSGVRYSDATGVTGPIMLRERDELIQRIGKPLLVDHSPWITARLITPILARGQHPDAVDARRLGADGLGQKQISEILKRVNSTPISDTLIIDSQVGKEHVDSGFSLPDGAAESDGPRATGSGHSSP